MTRRAWIVPTLLGGLALAADVVLTALEALVVRLLWGWFLVPALHVEPLPYAGAVGIALLAGLLQRARGMQDIEDVKLDAVLHGWQWLMRILTYLVLGLILGWIL